MSGTIVTLADGTRAQQVTDVGAAGGASPGSVAASPEYVAPGVLPAGTNRSGTATTSSGVLSVAANAARTGLKGQNISAVSIGFNEFGGVAAIGTAGTYTVPAGGSFSISTNALVNFIAASATAAVTMTEY